MDVRVARVLGYGMRIMVRDAIVAIVSVGATLGIVTYAQDKPTLKSTVFDWSSFPVRTTDTGSSRPIVRQPTATLDELEMHVTTLNPGRSSHAPHKHTNEELLILKEGTLEALVDGQWKKVEPGSIVFQASNSCHGVRNIGKTQATYHIVNWSPPGMLKSNVTTPNCAPMP
jgi:quercetin dioxygenase-like cupin family protein